MTITTLTAQAVADLVGGRLLGDGAVPLTAVGPLDRAGGRTLSFLSGPRYLGIFQQSGAGAVLLREEHAAEPAGPATRIIVDDPALAILRVVPALYPERPAVWGVDPTARIGPGASWGADVSIGAHAVLGRNVTLGDRCRLAPGVVLHDDVVLGDDCDIGANTVCHEGTRLGNRVRLKALAVIGGDGFGFASGPEGHRPIRHVGGCILEDDVQVGSHSAIDRGSLDDTVIGAGTKIDNQVHIAHNVRTGRGCLIVAGVGVAGSVRLGDGVILAGQVGVVGHVTLGDGARVSAQSGIGQDVPAGADMGGSPARRQRDYLRAQSALYRVAKIINQLEELVSKRGDRG